MPERAAGPWPANATFDDRGLSVAGVTAEALARRYGTPLLVADQAHLRERARTFARLFPHPLYAVKAFTSHEMIRLVADEGLDLLAATDGELEACLRAGVPASRIVLHGNTKSDAELALAVREGVRLVNVDNPQELERLEAAAAAVPMVQPILLRVVPEVAAGAHGAIRTGGAGSKFGTPLPLVPATVRRAMELPHVELAGIHAHIGSQVLEVEPYLAEIDVLLDLLVRLRDETGFEADILDVGGGFGVAYTDEAPTSLDEIAPAVLARVREGAEGRGIRAPHTLVEPGRSVVGQGMLTLYRVGTVKRAADGRPIVAVDGGMSDNVRPMLYGSRYSVATAGPRRSGGPTVVQIVGRHCESGDVLAQEVELPCEPEPGDLLAFAGTGAYTYSMASVYNRVGRPAVVAVADGRSLVWVRREDAADLDRLEPAIAAAPADAPPAQGVTIRAASPRDADRFLSLYRDIVAEDRFLRIERVLRSTRETKRRFRRSRTPNEAFLLAAEDDRIVGWISIAREPFAVIRHVATFGMAVAADRRGRGIGAALLAEALRWAREVGVEKVELSVFPENRPALLLYRRFGFVEEGRLRRHSRKSYGDVDEILMGVWLGEDR
ncbi:MAG TPA: diaminopimelate decarboxylase [Actinomycetota bacterium]|nr:diaminopimelate decarboxylase [Actinomycetota bacterium]